MDYPKYGQMTRLPTGDANDNKNLQIADDPYTMGKIMSEWNSMAKDSRKPSLTIVPK
jgi:hypothetical protein